ncbi:MAG TPA: FxLYD domain-containing protein [Chthonomonadaceae bacterium]|nr:FxLYD domain-containing protein [Chthonomonadaceae bacterium]
MSLPLRQQDWEAPLRLSAPKRRQHRRAIGYRKRVRAALALLAGVCICGFAAWGWQAVRALEAASSLRLAAAVTPGAPARVGLVSASAERRLGFVTITGSVANHATRTLRDVEAVAELLDSHGRTIGLESALIAFDPLPAGQPSPFRVEMVDNARAVAYRVRFRQISGSALD